LKLKLFILITLVDFAELLTDFSYTNFTVGLSNVDALDRLRVHWNIILLLLLSWWRGIPVTHLVQQSYSMPGLISTWKGDCTHRWTILV